MTDRPEHIDIQSFDFFQRIEKIHTQPAASQDNLRAKYILLYKVLQQACYELTTGVTGLIRQYVLQTGLHLQGKEDDSIGQICHTDHEA